jgi:predicted RNase H-like HicB family nuclease
MTTQTAKQFKIIIEKHPDGYIAYPLGLKGVVIGEGDTYEEALADVKSAIAFHIETFGTGILEDDNTTLEAFVAEARVAICGTTLAAYNQLWLSLRLLFLLVKSPP